MVGDAAGGVSVVAPSSGIIISHTPPVHAAAVTALASFPGAQGSIHIISGHSDGSLLAHSLVAAATAAGGAENDGKKNAATFSESVFLSMPTPDDDTGAAWVSLNVFPLHNGRRSMAHFAGLTAGGHVAWSRLNLGRKSKGQLHREEQDWGHLIGANDIAPLVLLPPLTWDDTISTDDRVVAVKALVDGVQVVTAGGRVAWAPMYRPKPPPPPPQNSTFNLDTLDNTQKIVRRLRTPVPCSISAPPPSKQHKNRNKQKKNTRNNVVPSQPHHHHHHLTHVAVDDTQHVTRYFTATAVGTQFQALHASSTQGQAHCRFLSGGGGGGGAPVIDSSITNADVITSVAVLPGYVVTLTGAHQLLVVNASGPFLRPTLTTLTQISLQHLKDEAAQAIKSEQQHLQQGDDSATSQWWWRWSKQTKQLLSSTTSSEKMEQHPLLAAGTATPCAAAPLANGLVIVQLTPRTASLYATSFPFTPLPRDRASPFRVNWVAALQPVLIACGLGVALRKAKRSRSTQQAAAQKYRARTLAATEIGARRIRHQNNGGGDDDDGDGGEMWQQLLLQQQHQQKRFITDVDDDDDDDDDGVPVVAAGSDAYETSISVADSLMKSFLSEQLPWEQREQQEKLRKRIQTSAAAFSGDSYEYARHDSSSRKEPGGVVVDNNSNDDDDDDDDATVGSSTTPSFFLPTPVVDRAPVASRKSN